MPTGAAPADGPGGAPAAPSHDTITAPSGAVRDALPYPVILDPTNRLARALDLPLPAILIVGRTGELWAAWGGDHAALPDVTEINSWLDYSLSECRECFCCELAWPEAWVRGEPE